jgi:hypothetical protein
MPRRTGMRRRTLPAPEPFDRTPAEWRRLGAPVDLYDLELAAECELAEHGAVLEPGEPSAPGPLWFYAARWWRAHRPPFLAAAGALTRAEQRRYARPGRAGGRQP